MLSLFGICLRKPLGMLALFAAMLPPLAQAQSLLGPAFATEQSSTDSTLSLDAVLALVLADNPELKALEWKIKGAKAHAAQAARLPNPTLEVQAENFSGTGDFTGGKSLEATVSLSQPIETGGKRRLRKDLALAEKAIADWEYRARRTQVLLDARFLFREILLMQEKVSLAEEDLRTEKDFLETQTLRRKAGKSSPLEEQRAKANLLAAELAKSRLLREGEALRVRLATLMSKRSVDFLRVAGRLADLDPIPPWDSLHQATGSSVSDSMRARELEMRKLGLALQRANALPDLEVGAGFRHFRETGGTEIVLGASMPLPVWNRNQGAIAEASSRVSQSQEEIRATRRQVKISLKEIHSKLAGLKADIGYMQDSLLPAARSAYQSAQEGHRLGRFSPLEILDARRAYIGSSQDYLDALAEYHRLRLEMESLLQLGGMNRAASAGMGLAQEDKE